MSTVNTHQIVWTKNGKNYYSIALNSAKEKKNIYIRGKKTEKNVYSTTRQAK